jgi:protoporphyrinogen oxidase
MKICIIGAGPTGLGAAYRLKELGFSNYTVLEKNPYVGGLATTLKDSRGFLWDLGVHVTHSHYTYFDKLLSDVLPDGYWTHQRRSWIRGYNVFVPYPFQYNIRHLPPQVVWDCVEGLLKVRAQKTQAPPRNYEEWVLSRFGAGIARHFLLPYNRKLWQTPPARMGFQWVDDRVPASNLERVLKNVIFRSDDMSWGPNSTFVFPRKGGTGAIWNAMLGRIQPHALRLSCEVVKIDLKRRVLHLKDGACEPYDCLVSTVPLPHLVRLCGLKALARTAARLHHTHVKVVGVAAPHALPAALEDKSWLYCPGDELFYRVTVFSPFSPDLVPAASPWCSLMCECSFPAGATMSDRALCRRVLHDLRQSGLFATDLRRVHTFVMDAPHGYPIPTPDRDTVIDELLAALEKHAIYSRGRFGGWRYEVANMDHSVMQGVEAAQRIVNNTPERTLFHAAEVNAEKR